MNLNQLFGDFDMAGAIATSVAPAIIVSACVLFISALQVKFHNLVDRIRHLDREIVELERRDKISDHRRKWIMTAEAQVDLILKRCRLVRDGIFILYVSIFLLIMSIMTAALGILIGINLGWVTFIMFLAAVLAIALANIQAIREVYLSFRVIDEEVANARDISPLREIAETKYDKQSKKEK
ncbi:MAG: DUF2721 domain-containing protein [bacterium]|nr:DUF2721 domain-containing protein [bacterium]